MVVTLKDFGIAFFGTPKCGVTSIYHGLHNALHGAAFDGPPQSIHRHYDTLPPTRSQFEDAENFWRITIVRDPVKRILSAYSNRVHDHHDLTPRQLRGRRERFSKRIRLLPSYPKASLFFRRHDAFAKTSWNVRHHTRPARDFIGSDLGFYDRVYTTTEMDDLARDLSERMGRTVQFPAKNAASKQTEFSTLSRAARRKVLELTRTDYDLLGDYFSPPPLNPDTANSLVERSL